MSRRPSKKPREFEEMALALLLEVCGDNSASSRRAKTKYVPDRMVGSHDVDWMTQLGGQRA